MFVEPEVTKEKAKPEPAKKGIALGCSICNVYFKCLQNLLPGKTKVSYSKLFYVS